MRWDQRLQNVLTLQCYQNNNWNLICLNHGLFWRSLFSILATLTPHINHKIGSLYLNVIESAAGFIVIESGLQSLLHVWVDMRPVCVMYTRQTKKLTAESLAGGHVYFICVNKSRLIFWQADWLLSHITLNFNSTCRKDTDFSIQQWRHLRSLCIHSFSDPFKCVSYVCKIEF